MADVRFAAWTGTGVSLTPTFRSAVGPAQSPILPDQSSKFRSLECVELYLLSPQFLGVVFIYKDNINTCLYLWSVITVNSFYSNSCLNKSSIKGLKPSSVQILSLSVNISKIQTSYR